MKESRFSGPGESPGFLLWQTTNRWQRQIRAALEPLDLTHVQFVLVACTRWFESQGSQPSQVELAELACTDVMMTSQVVRALEGKGLLERRKHPHDRRARALHLTNRGRALVKKAIPAVEAVDEAFFTPRLRSGLRPSRGASSSEEWDSIPVRKSRVS